MGHLEDRVILDNMSDLGISRGTHPESFRSISLCLPLEKLGDWQGWGWLFFTKNKDW